MFIKLIGGACIVLSGCLFANACSKASQKRADTLHILAEFAEYADKQIATVRMPPEQVLSTFHQQEQLHPLTVDGGDTGGLSKEEIQAFRSFFQSLGNGGWEEEQHRCRAYLDTIRTAERAASQDLPQQKKRNLLLGAAAGAGVALLLW